MSAIAILCILAIVLFITVFMVWASASIRSGVYVRAFCREKTDRKVVYLTFDDGPHPPETERVLDVLRERGARATFFLIGSKVSGNEAVLRRMLEASVIQSFEQAVALLDQPRRHFSAAVFR